MYQHINDGEWWFDTERELNGGRLGPRKPFPLCIYVDDTGVTVEGKKTAKPVFVYAGELHTQPHGRTASYISLRAMRSHSLP